MYVLYDDCEVVWCGVVFEYEFVFDEVVCCEVLCEIFGECVVEVCEGFWW